MPRLEFTQFIKYHEIDFHKVGERLKKEYDKLKKKDQIELKKKYDFSNSLWSNVLGDGEYIRKPSIEFAIILSKELDVSTDYILYNKFIKSPYEEKEDLIKIPHIESFLSNGNQLVYKSDYKVCYFNIKCLKDICINPEELVCIFVEGNSMAPYLLKNDCAIIDLLETKINDYELYLFNYIGLDKLLIRRFTYQNSKIAIVGGSDLSEKPTFVFEKDINIVGKIILSIHSY